MDASAEYLMYVYLIYAYAMLHVQGSQCVHAIAAVLSHMVHHYCCEAQHNVDMSLGLM